MKKNIYVVAYNGTTINGRIGAIIFKNEFERESENDYHLLTVPLDEKGKVMTAPSYLGGRSTSYRLPDVLPYDTVESIAVVDISLPCNEIEKLNKYHASVVAYNPNEEFGCAACMVWEYFHSLPDLIITYTGLRINKMDYSKPDILLKLKERDDVIITGLQSVNDKVINDALYRPATYIYRFIVELGEKYTTSK